MSKRVGTTFLAVLLVSLLSGTGAQAATKPSVKINGMCAKAGAKSIVSGKSYTCTKVLSGKLVWSLSAPTLGGSKPSITGVAGGEGSEGLESIHKKAKSGSTSIKAPSVASGEDD
jgi:hypothetical protein